MVWHDYVKIFSGRICRVNLCIRLYSAYNLDWDGVDQREDQRRVESGVLLW